MEEQQKKAREFVFSLLSIAFLIVVVLGATYAAFSYTGVGSADNTISTSKLTFEYIEDRNGINLVNAYPISDEVGKNLIQTNEDDGILSGYFDFTISSNIEYAFTNEDEEVPVQDPVHYEIYAKDITDEVIASESEQSLEKLDGQYVKVYLTSGDSEESLMGDEDTVPTWSSLEDSTEENSKTIYKGSFEENGSQNFRLRMWVAQNYTDGSAHRTFAVKVGVKTIK